MTGHPQPRRTPAEHNTPFQRRRRINLLSLALLLALALLLSAGLLAAGCGSEATTTTVAPTTTAPAAETTTTAAPAETSTTAAATATTEAAAEGAFPVTVTDDAGNSITMKAKPVRIISTAPASTEILFAIGAGDRVVGVNSLDDFPAEVKDIAKVGDFQLNSEAIMGLSPDLVFAYSGLGSEEALAPVKAAGAPIVLFEAKTVEGIYTDITTVGATTGNVGQAATLVESLRTQMKAISEAAKAAGSAPRVFYAVDATLWTVGTGTFVDELLKLANTVNVGSMAATAATTGYYQLAPEQLIAADPDIILLPDTAFMKGIEEFTKDPRFAELRAVKEGKVFLINDTIITRPGPRIAEGFKVLLEAVHPGAVK